MSLRILIVEDDGLIALDLAMTVEELGHVVAGEASEASEAIAVAGRVAPDLALMDLKLLRGTSGVDAAEAIYDRYGIRSLFVSGNIDGDVRERIAAVRPVGFLSKPISPHALARALDAFRTERLNGGTGSPAPPP